MAEFELDCSFCDEVIESESVETVKNRGGSHLEDWHEAELAGVFTKRPDVDDCHGCGSAFEIAGGGIEGFECSDCGYDNFQPLVQRYLYWQIELD